MTPFPMEWIEKAIRIDSVTHRSNGPMVRFLTPLLEQSGLHVEEQRVSENGETFINLIAFNQSPTAENALWFNTHLDTVTGGNAEKWTKTGGDPLCATVSGDRIYGLGSADVKIDFLCKLWAIRMARPNHPIVLVGTYGEERGLIGVQQLLSHHPTKPRFALVGEPSDLELIYAHKGHLIGTLALGLEPETGEPVREKSWNGVAAHSSTPALGSNALAAGLKEVERRGWGVRWCEAGTDSNKVPDECRLRYQARAGKATRDLIRFVGKLEHIVRGLKKVRDRRFSPSTTTLSLNMARSQQGELQMTFDMRTLPAIDITKLKQKVERAAPAGARWIGITTDDPLKGDKQSALMQAASSALRACGVKPVQRTKASSTEAAMYNRHGAEAIVFGPGVSIGNVHRPNEYNSISQIRVATQFYEQILRNPPTS